MNFTVISNMWEYLSISSIKCSAIPRFHSIGCINLWYGRAGHITSLRRLKKHLHCLSTFLFSQAFQFFFIGTLFFLWSDLFFASFHLFLILLSSDVFFSEFHVDPVFIKKPLRTKQVFKSLNSISFSIYLFWRYQ